MFPLKYYSILRNYFTFSEITGSADGDSAAYVSLSINLNATETATGIIPEYEQSFLTRAWYTALTSLQRGCCSSLLPEMPCSFLEEVAWSCPRRIRISEILQTTGAPQRVRKQLSSRKERYAFGIVKRREREEVKGILQNMPGISRLPAIPAALMLPTVSCMTRCVRHALLLWIQLRFMDMQPSGQRCSAEMLLHSDPFASVIPTYFRQVLS
ncbi:uncharacterized protein LOC135300335 isoform X2 [Passer domesticus]|uniref:uncharacterized protein LOC135300335 isoform X2 n=1 Tax=Passer domesticus TaxID=48849 RepID=UPI0030FE140A